MVVSAKSEATRVGVEILRRGGNAVDAAIAVHFALAVVLPSAGNLGGGGFLVVRTSDGAVHTYDYRETAPLAASEDMYLDEFGEVRPDHPSWFGALAVRGFPVDPYSRRLIAGKIDDIRRFPGAAAILLPTGQLPAVGDTLRQPALARTLRLIATRGPNVFYRGEIADSIVGAMERRGGLITHEDLRRYHAVERPPITFDYRGYTVHSMGPPSSGGITLKLILEQLETIELGEYPYHSARAVHRIVEAMRRAFAERNALLGDPDFVDIPESMLTESYAQDLAASIDTLRATSSIDIRPALSASSARVTAESTETTHFSIVDPMGNAVASTTTINGSFGSLETVAGFFLNNEMDDLTVKPGVPNAYGLVQGRSNAIQPGKRPLSAMTPTIVVQNGKPRFVVGSPGGSTIITTVAQILIGAIDYDMTLAEALDGGRFHHQHLPDTIRTEPWTLSEDTVAQLESMGHRVETRRGYSGRAQGIELGIETGLLYGRSDLRGGGQAAGF
jgi:gamma-glutamyltranspeptidase/glutathione hydrolase